MIFNTIVLENFGVYRGRHVIELTPPSPSQPIILFGGLNGSGKTTLLNALHLVLYGKRARCSNRKNTSYSKFLKQNISAGERGACLELSFRHRTQGEAHDLHIKRQWSSHDNRAARDEVFVSRDGVPDPLLTSGWDEHLEGIAPLGISQLFLFDGEQIEALAEVSNARAILHTAIHGLLGLDLIDRLTEDLVVLERRRQKSLKSDDEKEALNELEASVENIDHRLAQLRSASSAQAHHVDALTVRLAALDERFRLEGGPLYERRDALEDERSRLSADVEDAE